MENLDVISQNMFGFISALIGAIVGGFFTLKATDKAIREENAKEIRRDDKEVQNLLDALGVEISALWDFHMRRLGGTIEQLPDGQALEIYYPLTQDYFTIYNSNAVSIGRIKDSELRKSIVVTYNKCKKVVDGFKYNNEMVREYRDSVSRAKVTFSDGFTDGYVDAKLKDLIGYAKIIKEDHYELKSYIEQLLALLERRNQ